MLQACVLFGSVSDKSGAFGVFSLFLPLAMTTFPKHLLRLFLASKVIFYFLRLFLKVLDKYPLK